jgi:tRNA(Glu) U13 pseudouridine synthase TruD
LLDIETLRQPEMRFFAAHRGDEVVAIGGCWLHGEYAEVKRIYVAPAARGLGLAKLMMQRIEDEAMAAIGITRDQFVDLPFGFGAGERRPLRMPVADAAADQAAPDAVTVSFTLPRGCFATSVLRELLTETVWFAEE